MKCNCFDATEKELYNKAIPGSRGDRLESVTASGTAYGTAGTMHRTAFDIRWKTKAGNTKVQTVHIINTYCPFCGIKNE